MGEYVLCHCHRLYVCPISSSLPWSCTRKTTSTFSPYTPYITKKLVLRKSRPLILSFLILIIFRFKFQSSSLLKKSISSFVLYFLISSAESPRPTHLLLL